jgi:hypothetical protein
VTERLYTPSGALLKVEHTQTRSTIILDLAKQPSTPARTELIRRVGQQHATRRYINAGPRSRKYHVHHSAAVSYWHIECLQADEDDVIQIAFDVDGGVYVTAEEYLKTPSYIEERAV